LQDLASERWLLPSLSIVIQKIACNNLHHFYRGAALMGNASQPGFEILPQSHTAVISFERGVFVGHENERIPQQRGRLAGRDHFFFRNSGQR
jgi:hypothetical protein